MWCSFPGWSCILRRLGPLKKADPPDDKYGRASEVVNSWTFFLVSRPSENRVFGSAQVNGNIFRHSQIFSVRRRSNGKSDGNFVGTSDPRKSGRASDENIMDHPMENLMENQTQSRIPSKLAGLLIAPASCPHKGPLLLPSRDLTIWFHPAP